MAKTHLDGLTGGMVHWDSPLAEVVLFPTADGVFWALGLDLTIPASPIVPEGQDVSGQHLTLHGASGELRMNRPSGSFLRIAQATLGPAQPCRPGRKAIRLPFMLNSHVLARIEALRDGQAPAFELVVEVSVQRAGAQVKCPADTLPMHGQALCQFRVEHGAWVKALRDVGASRHVLVEIPLATSPRQGFEQVHAHILEALNDLDRGGELGWRGCAASIRSALDAWPSPQKGKTVQFAHDDTVAERMVKLRQALREVTHPAHHGPARDWTRADAVALLAAAAGLLARECG